MRPRKPYAIGVDTGGTHTDLVLAGDGRLATLKVPSTPADLSIGILEGIARYRRGGVAVEDVRPLRLREHVRDEPVRRRKGRRRRPDHDGRVPRRAGDRPRIAQARRVRHPLASRRGRSCRATCASACRERVDHRGAVLDAAGRGVGAGSAARVVGARVCASIAVCFLHAYANPAHERRIAEMANGELPAHRRLAFVGRRARVPRVRADQHDVRQRLHPRADHAPSRGSSGRALAATRHAPRAVTSCRATAAISTFASASRVADRGRRTRASWAASSAPPRSATSCGIHDLITLDMGGTSADVSLIANGAPLLTNRSRIGTASAAGAHARHGHHRRRRRLDRMGRGRLRRCASVRTARARYPGRRATARAGRDPTVTDANLVRGPAQRRSTSWAARAARPARSRTRRSTQGSRSRSA